MRKPAAILVVQVFLFLVLGVSMHSLFGSFSYTRHVLATYPSFPPEYMAPLAWHFGYKVFLVAALTAALVGSVRRTRWARWFMTGVLLFGAVRLGVELAVGFPDTPARGPVPGNYYQRHTTETERRAAMAMYTFILGAGAYLAYRCALGRDVAQYFGASRGERAG